MSQPASRSLRMRARFANHIRAPDELSRMHLCLTAEGFDLRCALCHCADPSPGAQPATAGSDRNQKHPLFLAVSSATSDLKVVLHRKYSRGQVRLNRGDIGIGLAVDYACKNHVSIVHNDVDRVVAERWILCNTAGLQGHRWKSAEPHRRARVLPQCSLRIDAPVNPNPDAIVVGRTG